MVKIYRYDTLEKDIRFDAPTVFLAGPTVRGNQPHLTSWRNEAIDLFADHDQHVNLIIPEFPSKESDQMRYDLPEWEYYGLVRCHCILFWIPRTKELIGLTTNHEHGYWMGREREKMVYGRPNDAYRMSYLDIMWVTDMRDRHNKNTGSPIHTNLKDTIVAAFNKASDKYYKG